MIVCVGVVVSFVVIAPAKYYKQQRLQSDSYRMQPLLLCDPAGARTQDPNIKSVVLYQLSYGIVQTFGWYFPESGCKYTSNIFETKSPPIIFFVFFNHSVLLIVDKILKAA